MIARPPFINMFGCMQHPLLYSDCFQLFQDEVLDVLFHTVPIRVAFGYIDSPRVLAEFLRVHDEVHGKDQRRLMKLEVVDRPKYLRYLTKLDRFMERRWRALEAEEHVSVEIVSEGR